MKVKINYSFYNTEEVIDLEDYGFESETNWDDLTEKEQYEVLDPLRDQHCITITAEQVD